MPFTGPIITEWNDDERTMTVVAAFAYVDAAGRHWPVPAGFVTDGASIPRPLWATVGDPFTGAYRDGAVCHDAAYATPGMDKHAADLMLREAALERGCPIVLADAIYEGVHLFGQAAFDADQAAAAGTVPA